MQRQEYMCICLVMLQEHKMLNYWLFKWFRKKEVVNTEVKPYPLNELDKLQQYKNKQHKTAMKASTKKDHQPGITTQEQQDDIRKAGL